MKQMLAANGFRWFSLWFNDPAAVGERLVKAGYPAPMKGGNVSMTRDPDGNVVELMGVPRGASGETFTWGMAVSDDTVARKFYGEVLGLAEFEPWNLPIAGGLKMFLFQTGTGRVKFAAPPGQRPREADAGPDAPGLRSVTLRVANLAAAREGLATLSATVEGEKRLLMTDPDGNRIYVEAAPPEAIKAAVQSKNASTSASTTANAQPASDPGAARRQTPLERLREQYGNITPQPHQEEIAEQRPGEPPLKKMPDGDPARDAAGRRQLFESICVPGITDLQEGMNGVAIVDLNKDGWLDIAIVRVFELGDGPFDLIGTKFFAFDHSGHARLRLFGGNDTGLDEPRDAHGADVKRGNGFCLRHPAVPVLQFGVERGNTVPHAEVGHASCSPSVAFVRA
jgi:hypothetical protein